MGSKFKISVFWGRVGFRKYEYLFGFRGYFGGGPLENLTISVGFISAKYVFFFFFFFFFFLQTFLKKCYLFYARNVCVCVWGGGVHQTRVENYNPPLKLRKTSVFQ